MFTKRNLILTMCLLLVTTVMGMAAYAQTAPVSQRVAGKLLLQVEQKGQIWYVDNQDNSRYKITLANALSMFRKLSLGISDADLDKIPTVDETKTGDMALRKRLAGQILLQVQDSGRIWYVNPQDLKRYEVTRSNLLVIFRQLSLGITDQDLYSIKKGKLASEELPTFASCSDLTEKLGLDRVQNFYRDGLEFLTADLAAPMAVSESEVAAKSVVSAPTSEVEYSETNVQVIGVDEADIVKTDGKYIYYIANGELHISAAYPASEAKLLSSIDIDNVSITEMFINGDNLLLFGNKYNFYNTEPVYEDVVLKAQSMPIWRPSRSITFVRIYDISDRSNPIQKRTLEFEGRYDTSRMIGDYVYFVMNSYFNYPYDYIALSEQEDFVFDEKAIMPMYQDSATEELEPRPLTRCGDISYIWPVVNNNFVTIIGLPISDPKALFTKEIIVGSSQNIYVSLDNIYISQTIYPDIQPLWEIANETIKWENTTKIHKLGINQDEIVYYGTADVPGHVLNQFSMDEYKQHFRIATTTGKLWDGSSKNHIYILDDDLNQVGKIEDIAPGEKIYSARFMGDKGYLVTFKNIDPFFTIDLSDPKNPKILGKLKIPGYSDYLHPYDENHIIGIGKEAVQAKDRDDVAWYQGLKIAIFDISDFENPVEKFKVEIGDRGTDSPLLHDHKALLFDKEKELFVLPILLAELTPEQKVDPNMKDNAYGSYTFQGAYVYKLNMNDGFQLLGRISHVDDQDAYLKSGYYFKNNSQINRTLYINNNLYTLSPSKIMVNDLDNNLVNLGEIILPKSEEDYYPYPMMR